MRRAETCISRGSFLPVDTVKPRTPETVIIGYFLPFLGFFSTPNQYKLYGNPENGKKKRQNYHFWGLRRLHVQLVPGKR